LTEGTGVRAKSRVGQIAGEIDWPYVILFGVVANVPMWIAGGIGTLNVAGWFNLDFFVAGILALFLPRALSACLLLLAILVDFLAEISSTFYLAPADILSNAPEIPSMSAGLIAQLSLGALLVLAIAIAVFFLPKVERRYATAILLASFALACRGTNALEEHRLTTGPAVHQPGTVQDIIGPAGFRYELPARSSSRQLMWDERQDIFHVEASEDRGRSSTPVESAAAAAYRWVYAGSRAQRPLPDFVLVIVESWGNSTDETIRQSLVQPYEAGLGGRFTIKEGTVPFHGATISGEDRELCGLSGARRVMVAQATDFRDCLPDELRGLGFHTIAIHGNHGSFYRREEWYPRAGFEEIWFKLKLESAGLPDCVGAFKGVCDAAIADWIGNRLGQPDPVPRFVYWVTLNSHLPVPSPPPLPTFAPCNKDISLASDLALCNWYRLILNVHQSLASLAAHQGPRPAVYVIVGDHSPPFSEAAVRNSFDQNNVPYVILLPNQEPWQSDALPPQPLHQLTAP
jgi:hypothetical protein